MLSSPANSSRLKRQDHGSFDKVHSLRFWFLGLKSASSDGNNRGEVGRRDVGGGARAASDVRRALRIIADDDS